MRYLLFILCLFVATSVYAQGDMRVYTVAGKQGSTLLGDGGLATEAALFSTEGLWMDANCNIYLKESSRIRKINSSTGIITTVAGSISGFSGDGGPATDARLKPYGLYVDSIGNIFIADGGNNRIRRVDASTNIITTYAGGGADTGNGGLAVNALLNNPGYVYGDNEGNIYIGERYKIRKINTSGIITTIAGTGSAGLSGDNGPAISAQVYGPAGMLYDTDGDLVFADRGNHRIRKIDKITGIITTIAGTTDGYYGDGGIATNAKLSGPISFVIDAEGNIIVGDNQNNVIRKIDAITKIITTIAGVGPTVLGDTSNGAVATLAEIHPEFMYLDNSGNIYYSCWCNQIRKITNYPLPGMHGNNCATNDIKDIISNHTHVSIHPNPTTNLLTIELQTTTNYTLLNIVGTTLQQGQLYAGGNTISLAALPAGIYLLHLNNENQRTVHKILKQ